MGHLGGAQHARAVKGDVRKAVSLKCERGFPQIISVQGVFAAHQQHPALEGLQVGQDGCAGERGLEVRHNAILLHPAQFLPQHNG